MDGARVPVLILAGGRATRLAGLTDQPKPLLPVAGRPFITYLLAALHQQGFRRITLLTGSRAEVFAQTLTSARWGRFLNDLEMRFLDEVVPLGTGGALRRALSGVETDALVLNGDSFCGFDYRSLLDHRLAHSAAFCLAAVAVEDAGDYGRLVLGEGDRISGFEEKGRGGPGWINAGVYALERRFLEQAIPVGTSSLENEILPSWIAREATPALRVTGLFRDIGTPERLARAAEEFPPVELRWLDDPA